MSQKVEYYEDICILIQGENSIVSYIFAIKAKFKGGKYSGK